LPTPDLSARPSFTWARSASACSFTCSGRCSCSHLRKAGTRVPGNRPTATLVRRGPYRFSRNPIYLAFTLFQIGLAAWVNSLGLLLALLPALALLMRVVIPREERYLEARFPAKYLPYKRAVRRWL
jgi:protein-S-isoprenylcysteine O-methyltransferase Ste14